MKILITGGSGFIGIHIAEEALRREMEVWVAVRKSTSRRYLTDDRLHFIELDFNDEEQMLGQLSSHTFDYVVHAAGVTKCIHQADFHKINTLGTQHFVGALLRSGMPIKRFVYLSSLSVFGAIHEKQPYVPITAEDTPQPNTAYGKSKLDAEAFLDSVKDRLSVVTLRPTGVYGPREKDYFMMATSIKNHVDFAA